MAKGRDVRSTGDKDFAFMSWQEGRHGRGEEEMWEQLLGNTLAWMDGLIKSFRLWDSRARLPGKRRT